MSIAQGNSICPTAWLANETRTLVNYFAPPSAPNATPTNTPSPRSSLSRGAVAAISAVSGAVGALAFAGAAYYCYTRRSQAQGARTKSNTTGPRVVVTWAANTNKPTLTNGTEVVNLRLGGAVNS